MKPESKDRTLPPDSDSPLTATPASSLRHATRAIDANVNRKRAFMENKCASYELAGCDSRVFYNVLML